MSQYHNRHKKGNKTHKKMNKFHKTIDKHKQTETNMTEIVMTDSTPDIELTQQINNINNVNNDNIVYLGEMTKDGGIVDTHVKIDKHKHKHKQIEKNTESDLDSTDQAQYQTVDITVESLDQSRIDVGLSEYGYPMVTYLSALKNHSITLELDIGNRNALINNLDIQFCFPGELTLLLKKIENELTKINITKILQQVTFNDWINLLKPQNIFELMYHHEEGFATVMCRTDQCAEAVMKGLGF